MLLSIRTALALSLAAAALSVGLREITAEAPATAQSTAPAKSKDSTTANAQESNAQAPAAAAPEPAAATADSQRQYTTERIQGRVVWMAEAVKKLHGVETDPDFAESLVALQTAEGSLVPILKDARGRGFMMDPRLRDRPLELLVRRYDGLPLVQVITVYTLRDGKTFELDYWCDICAISMYELKECECCQGPIRLRERPVVTQD